MIRMLPETAAFLTLDKMEELAYGAPIQIKRL